MKIVVFGSTGFIGTALVKSLIADGHQLILPVRNVEKAEALFLSDNVSIIEWMDLYQPFNISVKEVDAAINLLGENIAAKKWTNERKKKIYNSRIDGSKQIINHFKTQKIKVKKFIQASAIGIYGLKSESSVDEASTAGDDFLAKLCIDWENSLLTNKDQFQDYALIRTGMVLGKNGGALQKMLPIFKLGLAGKLGSGNQTVSWIHLYDLVNLYKLAATSTDYSGAINATSPFPISNKEFTGVLGSLLRKGTFMSVPSLALEIIFGELSSILLNGVKIIPGLLKRNKFHYRYPTIEVALKEVVSK
jgi:uncharacterized protein (TIGR01777 family)